MSGAAGRVLALLASRPPTLGPARLLGVDGPGGSGKTTLAAQVAARTGATVVHLDDLYDGWTGLDRVGGVDGQLATLLRPLAAGRPGRYRRYDWYAGAPAETVTVPPPGPGGLLVVEGVGAGGLSCADLLTVLAWIEAPRALRLRRGLDRDGEHLRAQWTAWQDAEDAHHARERTRARADLLLDGTAPPDDGRVQAPRPGRSATEVPRSPEAPAHRAPGG